jgi:hypothetical protein
VCAAERRTRRCEHDESRQGNSSNLAPRLLVGVATWTWEAIPGIPTGTYFLSYYQDDLVNVATSEPELQINLS